MCTHLSYYFDELRKISDLNEVLNYSNIMIFADHSLFINCGGGSVKVDGNNYEEDLNKEGPSDFASTSTWGYSSTGLFVAKDNGQFIASNVFGLNVTGPDYYKSARVAPQSLNYYGLCMRKGSYKVRLHFAEIMFSNNETFSSLGKRVFDMSIQVSNKGKREVFYIFIANMQIFH